MKLPDPLIRRLVTTILLQILFLPPALQAHVKILTWAVGKTYYSGQCASDGSPTKVYKCKEDHTSTTTLQKLKRFRRPVDNSF